MNPIRSVLPLAALAALSSAAHAQYSFYAATGHYYRAVNVPAGITWSNANAAAVASGGYLASILSAGENTFVYSIFDPEALFSDPAIGSNRVGPWFGAQNITGTNSFSWTSGEAVSYTNWYNGQPDGFGGGTQYGQFYNGGPVGSTWGDDPNASPAGIGNPRGYIVEYNTNPVPEPSAMFALGFPALALLRRRKRA